MDIEITFINQSSDENNSQVVIYQQNESARSLESAEPLTVIKDIASNKTQKITIPAASLQFKPTIWIGVVSPLQQQEVLNSAIVSDVNTELSLLGITKANLIMTGGGVGNDGPAPFKFELVPQA